MYASENNGENKKPEKRHLLNKPHVFNAGIRLATIIPRAFTYRVGELAALLSYLACTRARTNVRGNLARVFPNATPRRLRRLVLKTFLNYSKYLVDYCTFNSSSRERIMKEITRVEGTENITKALERGNGIILMTAHLGNWELGGIFFGNKDIKINVLTFRDGIDKIDEIKERYRSNYNVNTIVLGDGPFAAIEILNALGRNEVVAMLVDRGAEDGIEIPFFGKVTRFPTGPLLLAAQSGAPIIPGFVVREKEGYLAVVEDLIYVDKKQGNSPTAEDENKNRSGEVAGNDHHTAAIKTIKVFEEYIRKYPDQWYNFIAV